MRGGVARNTFVASRVGNCGQGAAPWDGQKNPRSSATLTPQGSILRPSFTLVAWQPGRFVQRTVVQTAHCEASSRAVMPCV